MWQIATLSEAPVRRRSQTCWCAPHNLLTRNRVGWRCISPSFAAHKLEVEPLFVVPGFVSGPRPDSCWDDIDGTMPQDNPLRLRLGKNCKAAAIKPLLAVGFTAGTPQWGDARSRPRNSDMAEGCFKRRDPAFTKVARRCFPLNGLVDVPSEHHRAELETQVADQEKQGNADGPPLGTLVVHVEIRERGV